MTEQEHPSEIVRIRRQIATEYEAARRALSDVAMVGRHAFITARQENIGALVAELAETLGIEQAAQVFVEALEQTSDTPE